MKSDSRSLVFMTVLMFIAGIALTMSTFGADLSVRSNERAGLFLGIMLLVLSGIAALKLGKEIVTVDPSRQLISIEKKTILNRGKKEISFANVEDVLIGRMGKTSGYLILYYIILKMKGGDEIALFTPGYFKGSFDRAVVEGWKMKLEEYLSKQ